MKRSDTRSRPPRADAARLARRAGAFALAAPAAALLVLPVGGCVGRGTHNEVVRERDGLAAAKRKLEDRVALLEASNESLGAERVALIDEMETLRQSRTGLERDVRKLKKTEELLSEHLRKREAELATTTEEISRLRGTYDALVQDLESEVAAGQIEIEQLREGLRLNMTQDILFASGSARLAPAGQSLLRKVAGQIRQIPNEVEVQGHTDDVPISTSRFPSNWELAAARATEVVRLLASAGVDAGRLSAISYGEFRPVASNETAEGRARNRRIEIRLSPIPEAEGAAGAGTPAKAEGGSAPTS